MFQDEKSKTNLAEGSDQPYHHPVMSLEQLVTAYLAGLAGMFAFVVIGLIVGVRVDERMQSAAMGSSRKRQWTWSQRDERRYLGKDRDHYLS